MTLTKEDLEEIRKMIREEIREEVRNELAPIREAMKQLLKTQIYIVSKLNDLEKHVYQIMHHINLSPDTAELENSLRDLD